jgi:hypothetical protein
MKALWLVKKGDNVAGTPLRRRLLLYGQMDLAQIETSAALDGRNTTSTPVEGNRVKIDAKFN